MHDRYNSYEEETSNINEPNYSTATPNDNNIDLYSNINTNTEIDYNEYKTNQIETVYNTEINLNTQNNFNTEIGNNNILLKTVSSGNTINTIRMRNPLRDTLRMSKNSINSNSSLGSHRYKNYYVPKCICLISVYPFFIEFSKILKTIYKYTRSPKLKKPIEKIIENLVIEVPVPPRGFYSVEYQLFNEKYILTQTPMNQLPFLSIEFEKIFVNFKIEQILEIYKHVLLETKIIFFSSDISNLTPIIQGLISLIYPFKYPFQFVTILPEENFNFLESISPYIIGINLKFQHNFFTVNEIDIENMTILVVDIDNRRLELMSPNLNGITDIIARKKSMLEEFPDLPKHYKRKLTDRIGEYINKIKTNNSKEDRGEFSLTIRNLFFQFIVNILQNYNKYLNMDYYTNNEISSPSINTLFKVEDYINSNSYYDRPFYHKLIKETQIFVEFILKRMIPNNSKEKLEILLFDENLIEKNSRSFFSKKVFTPFIHSKLYDIQHTYSVQKHRGFSEEENNYFKISVNRKEALKFGQDIFFDKNEICISYPVFPCLMTDVFFKNSSKLYFLPPNLSEELEPINIDIVSKSHLGSVSIHHSEMENYIYLCWIQLWAMTFWYHDEEEKRYRFQQLIKVLDSVINHEMEIFNFLFETLSKNGEDYMILKLYERLVFYKLNPSYSICTTVMRLIDKKQLLNKTGVGSIIKYVERYDFNRQYDLSKFRRRTFKNKFDLNILSNDVKFYTWDICIECQTNINLEKLSRDFHNMRRDILWVTCPVCETGLLPKIAVRFGMELNTYDKLKFNTSSYEGFVLYSPFYLKYNYNNGLVNEFGIKLDIESFKLRFNAIFWDSIWYFKLMDLNYDFMLPYENEVVLSSLNSHVETILKLKNVSKVERKDKDTDTDKVNILEENEINPVDKNIDQELKPIEIDLDSVIIEKNENKVEIDKLKIIEDNILDNNKNTTKTENNEKTTKTENNKNIENLENCYSKKSGFFSSDSEINIFSHKYKNLIEDKVSKDFIYSLSNTNIPVIDKIISPLKLNPYQHLNTHSFFNFEQLKTERSAEIDLSISSAKENPNSSINKEIQILKIDLINNYSHNDTIDHSQSMMAADQSFINPNGLVDNTMLCDSSRILDSDQSMISEMESCRGPKKNLYYKNLNIITEDQDENILLEHKDTSHDFFMNKGKMSSAKKVHHRDNSDFKSIHDNVIIIDDEDAVSEISMFRNKSKMSFDKELERDKTPIKSSFNSDKNIIDLFNKDCRRSKRTASMDRNSINITKSIQKLIDKIENDDKEENETIEKTIAL